MIRLWRDKLVELYDFYCRIRPGTKYFYLKLFVFFVVVNAACYWLAMITAFPRYVFSHAVWHYAKVSLPVSFLGALFDSLSFFVTIYLIRKAIASTTTIRFVAHLSVDFIIAVIATWWVLFVFVISGWMINVFDGRVYYKDDQGRWRVTSTEHLKESKTSEEIREMHLTQRKDIYTERAVDAMKNPGRNLRNIYFGLIMGLSAMLPTCVHLYMFFTSFMGKFHSQRDANE